MSNGDPITEHVIQIWGRARVNAFAHRVAAERYDCQSKILFFIQLLLSFSSLFLIILLYVLISGDNIKSDGEIPLLVTLSSVTYAMAGLGVAVMQNYMGFEQKFISHNHNQHSYLYIAQRAREVESPILTDERKLAVIDDLERDFQILKVRGQEPRDRDFRQAHQISEKIEKSNFGRLQTPSLKKQTSDTDTEEVLTEDLKMNVAQKTVGFWERNPCLRMFIFFVILYSSSTGFLAYKLYVLIYSSSQAQSIVSESSEN